MDEHYMPSRTILPPLTIAFPVSDSDSPLQLRYPLSLQSMDAPSKPSRTVLPPLTIVSDSDSSFQFRYPLSLQSMDAPSKPSRTVLPPLTIAFPVNDGDSPSPESSRSAKSRHWCPY